MDGTPTEIEDKILELKSYGGVDIGLLKTGTKILVETFNHVYEFILVNKADKIIRIESTSDFFTIPMLGTLVKSIFDQKGQVSIRNWIGRDMRMQLKTKEGNLITSPVVSACIYGEDENGKSYKYEVWE